MCEWQPLGVVAEGDVLEVVGSNIWSGKRVPLDAPPIGLAHPAFAGQTHIFRLYWFEDSQDSFKFAGAELSPNLGLLRTDLNSVQRQLGSSAACPDRPDSAKFGRFKTLHYP